eukprot:TRINITY_DN28577_c0_g1_i1.p1 TRINITY_DN28577_c0_g1~~TRINITY_DN28577_c0_g1_i1.p1  ORF type:complete len:220 (-),score=9.70 TRINITY_DN28577_c0_g1_i1:299-958(-)
MWLCCYVVCSTYIDLMCSACVVWNVQLRQWFFYLKCLTKVTVLLALAWRLSSRTWGAWVAVTILIVSMLFAPLIHDMSFDILERVPENEEIIALWVNRLIEAPIALICCCTKLSARETSPQVLPLTWVDTSRFVSKTGTWVEVCDTCDGASGEEHDATCCICLERIELNEVVTQLTCKHSFHTQCASQWMLRCARRRHGENNLCPMRCPITETHTSSPA